MAQPDQSPQVEHEAADAYLREGKAAQAEHAYRQVLARTPGDFRVLFGMANAIENQGRTDDAIAAYDAAIAANPGHALPFTRRALLLFRRHFGPPPAPAEPRPGMQRLTMSTLGANGRFGNQLLQYGFLRMYAEEHGLALETPDWIGRDLFDLDDPLTGGELPVVSEAEADLVASLNREVPAVHGDADLWGYCQYPTARLRRHRDLFRALFRPGRKVRAAVQAAEAKLRAAGNTLVAIHLRRGDFGAGPHWIAPTAWYAAWLDESWGTLDRPVLYVASDDPGVAAELARFRPVTAADVAAGIPGAEFYPDFHLLSVADALAISNSSFSFVAAMLNRSGRRFLRPDREARALAAFDPWDARVLI
jgi:hypothetical protein